MKKLIITIIAAAMAACPVLAQDASSGSSIQNSGATSGTTTDTPWFLNLDYAGFGFEIPAGSVVEKNGTLVARYPDGSFGVSMSNQEVRGSDQRRAFELCRMLSKQLELQNPEVKKVTVANVKGAKAVGTLEGKAVTVLILPTNDQELTTVIMASDNRQDWTDHFLRTMKH